MVSFVRRPCRGPALAALVACAALLLGPGAAFALDDILVRADRATVLELLPKTTTVIVGDPSIADVSLQKNGSVVVTGKSYGTTDLILQDATGVVLGEQLIGVEAASDGGQCWSSARGARPIPPPALPSRP